MTLINGTGKEVVPERASLVKSTFTDAILLRSDLKCPLYFLGPLPPLSSNWADGLLPASDAKVKAKAGTRAIIHIANLGSLDSASLECAAKGNIEVRFGTEVVAVKKNIWRTMVGMKQAQPRPSGIDGKGGSTTKVVPRVTTTRGEPIDY